MGGTAIVVARVVIDGKWFLIIAADSKSNYVDGQGPANICKIDPMKRGLLLLAGYRQEVQHYNSSGARI
jgi:hypothetical protein